MFTMACIDKKQLSIVLIASIFGFPASVYADGDVAINFKGTLIVPPPCIINGNKAIDVDFGLVETTKIDGNNYRQPVPYTLDCIYSTTNTLKLKVNGAGAGFDSSILQTSVADLGIALQHDTTTFPVNTWINFDSQNPPQLFAIPVKNGTTILAGGDFTAVATMQVDYQ